MPGLYYDYESKLPGKLSLADRTITVTLPCRNRLGHVRKTVDAWLSQRLPHDIFLTVLVVDYGCQEGAYDWVKQQKRCGLNAIKVVDEDIASYHYTRARNIGARAVSEGFVVLTDADLVPRHPDLLHCAWTRCLTDGLGVLRLRPGRQRIPFPLMLRTGAWQRLRGHCEDMPGWGHEDIEFWFRAMDLPNYGVLSFPADVLEHLPLPKTTEDRPQRPASGEHNLDVFREVVAGKREINPNGCGCCSFEYYDSRDASVTLGQFCGLP